MSELELLFKYLDAMGTLKVCSPAEGNLTKYIILLEQCGCNHEFISVAITGKSFSKKQADDTRTRLVVLQDEKKIGGEPHLSYSLRKPR